MIIIELNVLFIASCLVNKSVEVCHFRQLASLRDLERIQAIFHQTHMRSCANETFAITDVETKIRSVVSSRDTSIEAHCANDAVSEVGSTLFKLSFNIHSYILDYPEFCSCVSI